MIFYTYMIMAACGVGLIACLLDDESEHALNILIRFFIFLPLFGRVLGWW